MKTKKLIGIGAVVLLVLTMIPLASADVEYIWGGGVHDYDLEQSWNYESWLEWKFEHLHLMTTEEIEEFQKDMEELKRAREYEQKYMRLLDINTQKSILLDDYSDLLDDCVDKLN